MINLISDLHQNKDWNYTRHHNLRVLVKIWFLISTKTRIETLSNDLWRKKHFYLISDLHQNKDWNILWNILLNTRLLYLISDLHQNKDWNTPGFIKKLRGSTNLISDLHQNKDWNSNTCVSVTKYKFNLISDLHQNKDWNTGAAEYLRVSRRFDFWSPPKQGLKQRSISIEDTCYKIIWFLISTKTRIETQTCTKSCNKKHYLISDLHQNKDWNY